MRSQCAARAANSVRLLWEYVARSVSASFVVHWSKAVFIPRGFYQLLLYKWPLMHNLTSARLVHREFLKAELVESV